MAKAALLVLEDVLFMKGYSLGLKPAAYGEVVFNTSMTGLSGDADRPFLCGQIVVPTYPLIGNLRG